MPRLRNTTIPESPAPSTPAKARPEFAELELANFGLTGDSVNHGSCRRSLSAPLHCRPLREGPDVDRPAWQWPPRCRGRHRGGVPRPAHNLFAKSTAGGQPLVSRPARSGETIVSAQRLVSSGAGVINFSATASRGIGEVLPRLTVAKHPHSGAAPVHPCRASRLPL